MNSKLYCIAAIIAIVILITGSCAKDESTEPTEGSISGIITDISTNSGIVADVTISPLNIIHTTGSDGQYSFNGLNPGVKYSISAKSDNYQSQEQDNITVTAGRSTSINFSLTVLPAATISITSPVGGESFQAGIEQAITWSSSNLTGNLKIELMKTNVVIIEIESSTENDGMHPWIISESLIPDDDYQLKISSLGDPAIISQSAVFSIYKLTAPILTTSSVTEITQTKATCGGDVTSDGGDTVTATGVCWSISPDPTVDDSHTTDGNGTGSFTSSLTGLDPNETYYIRAYATNNIGTAYGNEQDFTTLDVVNGWIQWDDGENYQAIGTNEAAEFEVASRWEPEQLLTYEGGVVTQISFIPTEASATYSVRVWKGAGPAILVANQLVSNPEIDSWNNVTLTNPVPIDVTQELWVGYYVNTPTGYPAGCDDGPAIDGFGNMINYGGWQTLLDLNEELDYNWNLKAHVEAANGETMPISINQFNVPQQKSGKSQSFYKKSIK